MNTHEMNAILVEGVRRGMWVAVADGSEVRFFARQHVTLEIVEHALTAEELAVRLWMEEAATG